MPVTQIAFLESRCEHDLAYDRPAFHAQLKSYLLAYSRYRDALSIEYYQRLADVPRGVDIVGVSGLTQNFEEVIAMGREARETFPEALLILGGHHVSFLPETLPPAYDLAVMFEGESTLHEIVDAYVAGGHDKQALRGNLGIAFHDGPGQVRVNPPNAPIEPLDRIPFPTMEGDSPPYLFSSRGCPYKCTFCASTAFWQRTRFFSAEYVLEQVASLLRRKPWPQLLFWDDLVIADRRRFERIVQGIEERGLNRHTAFGFAVRANLVDEEVCGLLRRLNTSFVSFGAESGSNRILQQLKGKSVSVQVNQRALDLLHDHGITTICSFVVGSPGETRDDVRQTFSFIRRNVVQGKLHRSTINILMPLPGTESWRFARENGILTEPYEWKRFRYYASYKDSNVGGIDAWIARRLESRSYYLNEPHLPHRELLAMLAEAEPEIAYIEASRAMEADLRRRLDDAQSQIARLEAQGSSLESGAKPAGHDRSQVSSARDDPASVEVSVVVVCQGDVETLPRCLDSLKGAGHANLQVIVSAASANGVLEPLAEQHPEVSVSCCGAEAGFAQAANDAVHLAGGQYVLLLSPRTLLSPGALSALVQAAESHPDVAAFAPTIRREGAGGVLAPVGSGLLFDSTTSESARRTRSCHGGHVAHPTHAFDWRDGASLSGSSGPSQESGSNVLGRDGATEAAIDGSMTGRPAISGDGAPAMETAADGDATGLPTRAANPHETLAPSATAGLYRRAALQAVGPFDEALHAYYEDVDWGIRAQLRGCRCLRVAESVADYVPPPAGGTPLDAHAAFLLCRNRWYVVLKNVPLRMLWRSRRALAGGYVETLRQLRGLGPAGLLGTFHLSLLKRAPRILAARLREFMARRHGAERRIERWLTKLEEV